MPNQTNEVVQVVHNDNSTNYFFSPKHRGNPTDEISIWEVNHDTELQIFINTFQNGWVAHLNGWGISAELREILTLGRNLRNTRLIIAKFVVDQNQWHGYPADIRFKPKDKPIPEILLQWYSNGFISKSLLSRIKQGQI